MSEIKDIPNDVLDMVDEIVSKHAGAGANRCMALAILAERQRCAAIADKWAKDVLQDGQSRLAAAYIRQGIKRPTANAL